jgi:hypothetical protein
MQTHAHGIETYSKIMAKAGVIPYYQAVIDIPAQAVPRAAGSGPKSIMIGQTARISMQRYIDLALGYGVDVYQSVRRVMTGPADRVPDHVLDHVIARCIIGMACRRAIAGKGISIPKGP